MSNTVGERIRERRKEIGMTQAQLGARVGLTQTEISKIEQNRHDIRLSVFERIAHALDVPTFRFFDNAVLTTNKEVQDGRDTLFELSALIEENDFESVLAAVKTVLNAPFFRYAHNAAELLYWQSRAYVGLRKWKEGEEAARAGLAHEAVLHDDMVAALCDNIGRACQHTERPHEAVEWHRRAYKLVYGANRRRSSRVLRATVLYNLGRVYNMLANYKESERYLQRAEKSLKTLSSHHSSVLADILHLRGSQLFRTGQIEASYKMFIRAHAHHKANENIYGMSETLNNAAYTAQTLGCLDLSRKHYSALLRMVKDHPDKVSGRVIEELRKEGFDV